MRILNCFFVFIIIASLTACNLDKCTPTACVTLTPTAEDVSSLRMYKYGSTYKFLLNGKDTLSYISSNIIYYEASRDEGGQTEGCHYHYASVGEAKVRLTGINNNKHIDMIVSTWKRARNVGNMGINALCALTLDKDSVSTFEVKMENPFFISVDLDTDTLLFSKKTMDNFNVANKIYNDVFFANEFSTGSSQIRFYYHKEFGLLKVITDSGETLELIE